MNMTFTGGENATPILDEDDPARSELIDVTVLRKTCVDTGDSVLQFLSGHRFSKPGEFLGDNVLRTQVSTKIFLLLHVPKYREKIIQSILKYNP